MASFYWSVRSFVTINWFFFFEPFFEERSDHLPKDVVLEPKNLSLPKDVVLELKNLSLAEKLGFLLNQEITDATVHQNSHR